MVLEFPKAFIYPFEAEKKRQETNYNDTMTSCKMYSTVIVSFGNGILLLKNILHTGLPEHTLFYLGTLLVVL